MTVIRGSGSAGRWGRRAGRAPGRHRSRAHDQTDLETLLHVDGVEHSKLPDNLARVCFSLGTTTVLESIVGRGVGIDGRRTDHSSGASNEPGSTVISVYKTTTPIDK